MQAPQKSHSSNNPQHNSMQLKHHLKCVCEICNCGRHRCPQKSHPLQGQTTHNHYYQPYTIMPQRMGNINVMPSQQSYDANLMKSTYQSNYQPYKIQKQGSVYPQSHLNPKAGKFYDQTEYKKSYVQNTIKVDKPFHDIQYSPNNAKFDGTTTYNQQYSKKPIYQSPQTPMQYPSKSLPFEGQTTYKDQFKPHKVSQSTKYELQDNYMGKKTPFIGESRYKQEYKDFKVQQRKMCETEGLPSQPKRLSPEKDHLHFNAVDNRWQ